MPTLKRPAPPQLPSDSPLLVVPRAWLAGLAVLIVAPWEGGHVSLAIGLPTAVLVARGGSLVGAVAMLPLGASAAMLGFGFLLAFDAPPLDLRSSPWIVPLAQALIATPFVVRTVAPRLRAIDASLREAAAVLGAPPGRVRREIVLPLASRAVATAAALAFAVCLGEFGAALFLSRADWPTLPVAIFRFLGRPGELNAAQAYALAVVLMIVTALAVFLVERVRSHRGGWV